MSGKRGRSCKRSKSGKSCSGDSNGKGARSGKIGTRVGMGWGESSKIVGEVSVRGSAPPSRDSRPPTLANPTT